MIAIAQADTPRAITQLRQLVKGLEREGNLLRDHTGAFHLAQASVHEQGVVVREGKQLCVNGWPIETPSRSSLRVGDTVAVRVVGEQARVVDVIDHAQTPVTGILRSAGRRPFVEGLAGFRGQVTLLQVPADARDGDTVQVRIVDRDQRGPIGRIQEVLTHNNVLEQAIATAVADAQIPCVWPPAVTAAAARLPRSVNPGRHVRRRDLTTLPLVTIDGASARDFDDAVFAEAAASGGHRLVVAIADVAHYVKRGGVLDLEARERGTSVYFPTTVIPMLPESLSNGLCSLRPHTPRLALVCDMQVDARGTVRQFEFYEAVIRSHARLTYEQVQAYVDERTALPPETLQAPAVGASLDALVTLHGKLSDARERRGALDFPTREAQIVCSEGRVTDLQSVQRLLAHRLIEEAMIAANVCAATFLEAQHRHALYRVHEPPEAAKIEELRQALAYVGVRLAPGPLTPAGLQGALNRLPDHVDAGLYAQLALRTLQQAVYSPHNDGHFGLALDRYMHFTSPIRRYPDLVVHRAIKAVLAEQQGGRVAAVPDVDELLQLGELTSYTERRAENAGWLVDAWLKCDYLLARVGETLSGIVCGVTEFGLFVELEGYYVQGLLHISNLGQDYFHHEARALALVGERSGRRFSLGDELRVILQDVDPPQGRIDLQLAGAARGASPHRPGGRDARGGRRRRR